MSIISEERLSDSPYVETITKGWTVSDGLTTRPADSHWHMVSVTHESQVKLIVVGPWATSGVVSWAEGAEILWIKFRMGTCMPHLPLKQFLNVETPLPEAASRSFWLKGSAWQHPGFENADTFIARLVREELLIRDPVVTAALQNEPVEMPSRTVRHRFLQTTGLSQNCIRQIERAQRAATLLGEGVPVLETVYEAGYFDQAHLTRSLKRFIGHTPSQVIRSSKSG